jgi:hypothetical protein
LVSPAFRAAGGGCLRTRSRPLRRMTFGGSVVSTDEVTLDFREACERRNLRNQGALAKRLLTNSR